MLKTRLTAAVLLLGLVGWIGARASNGPEPSQAQSTTAEEPWQKEFESVCVKTQDAMTLSQEELTDLIRRCDALQPQIEKLDETRKKVYLARLRMCRGLYAYVLDSKKSEKK